jgi:hypothetical protein
MMEETDAFVALVQQNFAENGTWDMAAIEKGLREALLNDGCRILEALFNQPSSLGAHVPKGSLHDYRTRTVHCLLGSFELKRGYYHSEEESGCPMDRVLGLIDSYSPGLAKSMCRAAGTDGSYDEAEQTLEIYAGVHVPASQIRRIVQMVGGDLRNWSLQRNESRCGKVPALYVSYDGTGVPMRKEETAGRKGKQPGGNSKSREVKLGCVFTSTTTDEKGNPKRDPQSTTYLARFGSAEEFGLDMLKEARLRGLGKARCCIVIGDGAHWIWNQASVNFPGALQILDYYHAREHLTDLATALYPNPDQRDRQLSEWIPWLDAGEIHRIIKDAEVKKARNGKRRTAAIKEMNYFRTNAPRMQYAAFKKEGLFIGSGVVEAGCKTVVGKRTKQSGMFWRVDGAQNILEIRCSVLSDTYDDYWNDRRESEQIQLLGAA